MYSYDEYNNKVYLNIDNTFQLCYNKKDASVIDNYMPYNDEFISIFSYDIVDKLLQDRTYINGYIIELVIVRDPFLYKNYKYLPERHRYDKTRPDSVYKIKTILNLHNISVANILGFENENMLWKKYSTVFSKKNKVDKRKIMNILSKFSTGNILDIGCGTSKYTPYLIKKENISGITGIEKDEYTYILGKGRINTKVNTLYRKKIKLLYDDFNTIDLKIKFDTVLCINSIQFVNSLQKINRLLEDNGIIIIVYMDAGRIYTENRVFCKKQYVCYAHSDYKLRANYDNVYSCASDDRILYKNIKPLLNTEGFPYSKQEYINIKLPYNCISHTEKLIYPNELKDSMINNGFVQIENGDININYMYEVYKKCKSK